MGKKGVSLKKLFTGKSDEEKDLKDEKDDFEEPAFGEKQPQAIEMLRKIQEQLMFLERKVDTLLAQGGGGGGRPRFDRGGSGGGDFRQRSGGGGYRGGQGGGGGRDRGFGGGGDRGFRPRSDRPGGGGGYRGGQGGGGRDRGFGGGGARREWQGNRPERPARPHDSDRQPSNWSDQPKNI